MVIGTKVYQNCGSTFNSFLDLRLGEGRSRWIVVFLSSVTHARKTKDRQTIQEFDVHLCPANKILVNCESLVLHVLCSILRVIKEPDDQVVLTTTSLFYSYLVSRIYTHNIHEIPTTPNVAWVQGGVHTQLSLHLKMMHYLKLMAHFFVRSIPLNSVSDTVRICLGYTRSMILDQFFSQCETLKWVLWAVKSRVPLFWRILEGLKGTYYWGWPLRICP